MRLITLAAAASAALFANVAFADTAANSPESATRLTQSECTNLWQQANPSNVPGLPRRKVRRTSQTLKRPILMATPLSTRMSGWPRATKDS